MTRTEVIEELISFVGEAGGSEDFTQIRYWGYTYLEQEKIKACKHEFEIISGEAYLHERCKKCGKIGS